MGMLIAQEGSGFPFFTQTAYKYLCNEDVSSLQVTIADIPNQDVRNFLEKVHTYIPYMGFFTPLNFHKFHKLFWIGENKNVIEML